jgi:prevent-host-death family protein
MESIGAFEAKTHLAALLERASRGETIVITRHGKPVARLVPPNDEPPRMTVEEAVEGLLEFRRTHTLGGLSIKELINEGRKY